MRKIPFSSLQDVYKSASGREIVLFGGGNIMEKTNRLLGEFRIRGITDNAANLWGHEQLGYTIFDPNELTRWTNKEVFVIICTTSFGQVSEQLSSLGYRPKEDFVVSPILNDLRIISEFENIKKSLMFSSGSPAQDSLTYGGGIYSLEVEGDEWKHEKKISGNCYGIIRYGENYISVDTERGIFEFDKNFEIIRESKFSTGTRGHGVAYSGRHHCFYVVGSYLDAVLVIDADTLDVKEKIHVSNKQEKYGAAYHHCNDCCVVGDSLYVSMFSATGNWKNDIFDGAVVEFDLTSKRKVGVVMKDLWMPHNISFHGGSLTVLDSLPGYLRKNNAKIAGQFPAFTRGLAYDGMHYYIGQSRNRNFSKNLGVSNNISIDTAIVIFDELTKVSRSLHLPSKLSEIHAIAFVD